MFRGFVGFFVVFILIFFQLKSPCMKQRSCRKCWCIQSAGEGTNLFRFHLRSVVVIYVLIQFLVFEVVCHRRRCAISSYWNRRRWSLFKVNQQLLHRPQEQGSWSFDLVWGMDGQQKHLVFKEILFCRKLTPLNWPYIPWKHLHGFVLLWNNKAKWYCLGGRTKFAERRVLVVYSFALWGNLLVPEVFWKWILPHSAR